MAGGYIKLYRSMLDWEWFNDSKTLSVFLFCLLSANHESTRWRGIEILPGQFVTSVGKIAKEMRLSIQSIRTSFLHLKSTGELTIKSTSHYTLVTVNNWANYQNDEREVTNKSNKTQQTINKQSTTNKNDKNDKNVNKEKEIYKERHPHGEFLNVFLSDEELSKVSHEMIERLSAYKASTGKNYKSDYATILNWSRKDRDKPVKSNVSNFKGREYSASHFAEMEEDLSKYAKADN